MNKKLIALVLAVTSFQVAAKQQEISFVMEATYAPFEYIDQNNQIQGFDVDLANALCKELDAKCSFHNQAFDSLIPALKFHRYDAAISAMDITEARSQQVSFTAPYYDNAAIFVASDKTLTNAEQLKGKRVGVQNGSTHQSYLLDKMPDVTPVPYGSYQDAFMDMKTGRINAVFGDTAVIADWVKKDADVSTVGQPVTDKQYFGNGFGIAVGKDNTELLGQLNKALVAVKKDGTYQEIFNTYFAK
ncbi:arginine ABC transporter substrate-binding protein [Vibrio sp. SS-MA-C1-2]|uniref:arginine ABC transporter substrate-binding protein n=1 Tax=Vibrio sp. SS-MA-C1-2 TaxID=2908646 RepID=UPI001F2E0A43|nr:arginine ABC transporter substrate-binding protein [Vibrio sp. SS-MA-C1-2]UJF20176.1 arginine ABC transporter substrate-binding protein [Vibrio sp. SS-MA-C1-2]